MVRAATVVLVALAQSFTIGDLPTGTYHVRYTTAGGVDVDAGDQTITAGQDISTSIPAAGVIAVYSDPITVPRVRLPIRIRGN